MYVSHVKIELIFLEYHFNMKISEDILLFAITWSKTGLIKFLIVMNFYLISRFLFHIFYKLFVL